MELLTPQSSNITGIKYDPATQVLTVTFKNNSVFAYHGVPQGQAEIFMNNPTENSHGKHFNQHIKGQYSSEMLNGAPAPAAQPATPAPSDNKELSVIDKSLLEFAEAGNVLKANQERATKALAAGKKILADYEAGGKVMTPELDERMQKYLVNCNKATKEMNDARKVYTQMMDIIRGAFTAEENKLDVKKEDTYAFQMQKIRNEYAAFLHQQEQQRQREIEQQQLKSQEAINLKAECLKRLYAYFNEYLQQRKMSMNATFNQITLEIYEEKSKNLRELAPAYPYQHFKGFVHGLTGRYHTASEIETLFCNVIEPEFNTLAEQFKKDMCELRDFLIDRLPSKKQELESIHEQEEEMRRQKEEQERIRKQQQEAKNEVDRKRLAAEQAENQRRQQELEAERQRQAEATRQREEQERQRLELESQERQREQQQAIESQSSMEQTILSFGAQVEVASTTIEKRETRTGYEIEVLGPAGWMAIVQKWFELKGLTLTNDELAGTKLESMKTFCEKQALKDEKFKIQSPLLRYKETFKAVNRRIQNKAA